MCFQRFTRYVCNHVILIEEECGRAAGVPFYEKVACSDYQSEHNVSSTPCGLGGFYCKWTPDGRVLESVNQQLGELRLQLEQAQDEVAQAQQQHRQFNTSADVWGLSQDLRLQHPSYAQLTAIATNALQKRDELVARRQQRILTLQAACQFYRQREQRLQQAGLPWTPPFDEFIQYARAKQQETLLHRAQQQGLPFATGKQALQPAQPLSANIHNISQAANAGYTAVRPHLIGDAPSQATSAPQPVQPAQPAPAVASVPKKKGRPKLAKNSGKKQDTPDSDAGGLRRSTRTRNKKVAYAESLGSSISSREPSPDKSEASVYSQKSDLSESPTKNIALRKDQAAKRTDSARGTNTAPNLGSLINDWSRKSKGATPGRRQLLQEPTTDQDFSPATLKALNAARPPPGIDRPRQILPDTMLLQLLAKPDYIKRSVQAREREENQARQTTGQLPSASAQTQMRPPTRYGPPSGSPSAQAGTDDQQQAATPNFLPQMDHTSSQVSPYGMQRPDVHTSTTLKPIDMMPPPQARRVASGPPSSYNFSGNAMKGSGLGQPNQPFVPTQQNADSVGGSNAMNKPEEQAQSAASIQDRPYTFTGTLPAPNESVRPAGDRSWLINTPLFQTLKTLSDDNNAFLHASRAKGSTGGQRQVQGSADRSDSVFDQPQVSGMGLGEFSNAGGVEVSEMGDMSGMGMYGMGGVTGMSGMGNMTGSTDMGGVSGMGDMSRMGGMGGMGYMSDMGGMNVGSGLEGGLGSNNDMGYAGYTGGMDMGSGLGGETEPTQPTPHHDSNSPTTGCQSTTPAPAHSYDDMRRSFSASSKLTPASAFGNTSVDADPKKRRLTPSNPDESPSKKRMRLSLPGEEVTIRDGPRDSFPSEFRASPSQTAADDSAPTPAPILMPKGRARRWDIGGNKSDLSQTLATETDTGDLAGHEEGGEEVVGELPEHFVSEVQMFEEEFAGEWPESEIHWIAREEGEDVGGGF
ncbi:uncharacterized protein LTR77_003985 [Saxophila tyrrhenica]|uniref:Uncharacterized protein n=1 Tax=Saxophila tyrrhenica TaxID=1690608 RepID=A0AAV9PI71_9PEZI|nr:hypothetical protein LTR77_003985 [Saxophila tyrrhenica]